MFFLLSFRIAVFHNFYSTTIFQNPELLPIRIAIFQNDFLSENGTIVILRSSESLSFRIQNTYSDR